jgi:hypothetical protein
MQRADAVNWEIIVAIAAPLTPVWRKPIKVISRMILSTVDIPRKISGERLSPS